MQSKILIIYKEEWEIFLQYNGTKIKLNSRNWENKEEKLQEAPPRTFLYVSYLI